MGIMTDLEAKYHASWMLKINMDAEEYFQCHEFISEKEQEMIRKWVEFFKEENKND